MDDGWMGTRVFVRQVSQISISFVFAFAITVFDFLGGHAICLPLAFTMHRCEKSGSGIVMFLLVVSHPACVGVGFVLCSHLQ